MKNRRPAVKVESFTSERELLSRAAQEHGWKIEWRHTEAPHYQLAKIVAPNFVLIAYPHRTKSTGNRHIRIRVERGDRASGERAILELDALAGLNCTFQPKHRSEVEERARIHTGKTEGQ